MAGPLRAAAGQDRGIEAGEVPADRGVRVTLWHVGSAVPGNEGRFIHIFSVRTVWWKARTMGTVAWLGYTDRIGSICARDTALSISC